MHSAQTRSRPITKLGGSADNRPVLFRLLAMREWMHPCCLPGEKRNENGSCGDHLCPRPHPGFSRHRPLCFSIFFSFPFFSIPRSSFSCTRCPPYFVSLSSLPSLSPLSSSPTSHYLAMSLSLAAAIPRTSGRWVCSLTATRQRLFHASALSRAQSAAVASPNQAQDFSRYGKVIIQPVPVLPPTSPSGIE